MNGFSPNCHPDIPDAPVTALGLVLPEEMEGPQHGSETIVGGRASGKTAVVPVDGRATEIVVALLVHGARGADATERMAICRFVGGRVALKALYAVSVLLTLPACTSRKATFLFGSRLRAEALQPRLALVCHQAPLAFLFRLLAFVGVALNPQRA